jgi:hypothetical protein
MGWFRVDDEFLTNPKVMALSAAAKVLYVSGLAYCSTNLTDGHIPAVALGLVAAAGNVPAKASSELVHAGLWHKAADGWDVHDYLEHQDPAERIRARRASNRERAQSWREKRRTNANGNGVTNERTNAVSHASDSTAQHITPPKPSPAPTDSPPPSDGTKHDQHPDQAVLDHIAATIGWTHPRRQADLTAVWDWGTTLIDRRLLEDTLLACREANHPNYLRQAVTKAAQASGVTVVISTPRP